MAFNTGNPLGSTDPRDLSDNSENLDKAVNDLASPTWTDRFGNARATLAGQIGYIGTGVDGAIESYTSGLVLTTYSTIIEYNGEFYRPSASATLPYTTTATLPDADSNLVAVGDAVLRQDLASSLSGEGASLVSMEGGPTVEDAVNQRTIFVDSVAELEALSLAEGVNVYLTEAGKAGPFVIKSGPAPANADPHVYVTIANGNHAERIEIQEYLPSGYKAWDAPAQQNYDFVNTTTFTSDKYYSDLFDKLLEFDPGYVTKTLLGPDSSGLYSIYKYEFTPENYEKTIVITSGMHGAEIASVCGIHATLNEVVNNWRDSPQLAYIRQRVRLVVIPIVNPWGINQSPQSRVNANGVDINRNFDYLWNEYTVITPGFDSKGSAPFSEVETQYIRDTILANPDADTYLDFHDFVSGDENYPLYFPAEYGAGQEYGMNALSSIRRDGEIASVVRAYMPSGFNWAASQGLNSANPEWAPGAFGFVRFSSQDMTELVRWQANILMSYAHAPAKGIASQYIGPRSWLLHYEAASIETAISFPGAQPYAEITDLNAYVEVDQPGYVKVTGFVVIQNTFATGTQASLSPIVGQEGYGPVGQADTDFWGRTGFPKDAWFEAVATTESDVSRVSVPICAVFPVNPSTRRPYETGSSETSRVKIGLSGKASGGTTRISRYRAIVEFVPAFSGDERFRSLSATGNEGLGEAAMVDEFPKY